MQYNNYFHSTYILVGIISIIGSIQEDVQSLNADTKQGI